jgi:hypothetical protein
MARLGLVAALAIVAFGCGGGDPCAGSPCPNDAKPTQNQYDQCVKTHDANRNGKCYQPAVDLELCQRANVVCNSAGSTDGSLTFTKQNNNCTAATNTYLCCTLNINCTK